MPSERSGGLAGTRTPDQCLKRALLTSHKSIFIGLFRHSNLNFAFKFAIKSGVKLRGTYQITRFTNPNKSKSYRVIGTTLKGVRVRENYKTEPEALARKQQLEVEALNTAPEKRITTTRLTPEQEAQAERAFADLGDYPMPLAIRFFLENYREPTTQIQVKKAFLEFIAAKELAGLRPASIKALNCRVGFLENQFGEKLVSEILPAHVNEAIAQPGVTEETKQDNRRSISSFFSWCIDKQYCVTNPAKKTSRTRSAKDDAEPAILTLAEVRKLLATARNFKGGKLIPYVALSLFTGIRPTELARISWEHLDLDAGTITIGAKLAKMRQRRIVEFVQITERDKKGKEIKLPANLRDWLLPHAKEKTPFRGKNWRKDFDALKKLIGFGSPDLLPQRKKKETAAEVACRKALKPWTPDILRHTAISQHLAYFQHEGKTATWAGNSPDIIQRHYKGLVKPADAKEFWAITHDSLKSKTIPLATTEHAA
jgi:integrase